LIKFRPTSEQDKELIADWIERDPDHRGRCSADFWLPGDPDIEQYVVEDEEGPVMFVRAEKLMRLHVQFSPNRIRVAPAIDEFTPWISNEAKKRGYKQLIFESVFKPLIRFLGKRGFRSSPNEQVKDL
jgi:hypothetical protein